MPNIRDIARNRLQQQLQTALRQTLSGGRPNIPEAGWLLWAFFVELSAVREGNGFGPNPISHSQIEAWARLHGWPIRSHHIAIIRALDDTWLEHAYSKQAGVSGKASSGPSSPISADMFDAVFG